MKLSSCLRLYTDIYNGSGTASLSVPTDATYDQAADAVLAALEAAIVKRVENSERPIAFLCSGGLDSSIVLSVAHAHLSALAAQQHKGVDVHAFSVAYGENSTDATYAGLLCRQLGIPHTIVTFNWNDVDQNVFHIARHIESYDVNSIRTAVPAYMLAKHIYSHTDYKVILSGEGADEIFMGYSMFMGATDGEAAHLESMRLVRDLHMFDMLRADRCFAAWGLELRVPFLDVDVLRTAFALPPRHRLFQGGVEKALLRHAFRCDMDLVIARVLDRQKERFSDGCGFGYVPALLSRWAPPGESGLTQKEASERWVYRTWFDAAYPGLAHLIGGRPALVGQEQEGELRMLES